MINLILRKLLLFSFMSICCCFWETDWTRQHSLLVQSCNRENTKTLANHNIRQHSCMINLILWKTDFLQFLKHWPLLLGNRLDVKTWTSVKIMRFGEHYNTWKATPLKTHLHDKSQFEKNWLSSASRAYAVVSGQPFVCLNIDFCRNHAIRKRKTEHLKITTSENSFAW